MKECFITAVVLAGSALGCTLAIKADEKPACELTITSPREDETVPNPCTLKGTIKGDVPKGKQLWVLMRFMGNYYITADPPTVAAGRIVQDNIRMNTPGEWQIHIVECDEAAVASFTAKAKAGNFAALDKLPPGAKPVTFVIVKRN